MATYKVLQDIEAEDKILGPLTLRQFIYGLIAIFFLYICFICLKKGAAFLLVLFLPPALFTGFFAFPFGKDQSTEVWALAKIRFMFKPRRRIWDQSGVKELVTITAPKKIEQVLTNGLSQNEVQSRLSALANTIDSRGWAVKNVNVNLYNQPDPTASIISDRLIDITSMPREVPDTDVQASDDMLDETNNPVAQQFDSMITASAQSHRDKLVSELNAIRNGSGDVPAATQPLPVNATDIATPTAATAVVPPNDYWFMGQVAAPANVPADQTSFDSSVVHPGSNGDTAVPAAPVTPDDTALAANIRAKNDSQQMTYAHLRTLQPLSSRQKARNHQPQVNLNAAATDDIASNLIQDDNNQSAKPMTATPDPAILNLANNNDLNVATLAREAYKTKNPDGPPQDEVVISLH